MTIYLLKKQIMKAYFLNITEEEKKHITERHISLYDGYKTLQPKGNNMTPLQVEDLAEDKNGITVSNEGEVMEYKNKDINKKKKKVCESCGGLYEGKMCECSYKEMEEEKEECKECGTSNYTMEDLEENIKNKSKINLISEEINKSLNWFNRLNKY